MTEALELPGRSAPLVRSIAQPPPLTLLGVRLMVQRHPDLQQLFVRFRVDGRTVDWLMDMLAVRLAPLLPEVAFEQVIEAAQYLADEYDQLGEGPLLVSRETGRAVLVLSEEDLVDPGLLPRESGDVGQALKRLHPALESAIVTSYHEQGRDYRVLGLLEQRSHPTQLLRDVGDRRLKVATRSGRRGLAKELGEDDAWRLLERAGGTAGMLLRHFALADGYEGPWGCVEGVASARSVLGTQDMTTLNLGYDRLGVLRGTTPQAWLRDIARHLWLQARSRFPDATPRSTATLTERVLGARELWVVDPDVFLAVTGARGRSVPVEGVEGALGLRGTVGRLVVPHAFSVESEEAFDHWEVTVTLPFRLYVDWSAVEYLALTDVARAAVLS